jgi:hypothetical protein
MTFELGNNEYDIIIWDTTKGLKGCTSSAGKDAPLNLCASGILVVVFSQ